MLLDPRAQNERDHFEGLIERHSDESISNRLQESIRNDTRELGRRLRLSMGDMFNIYLLRVQWNALLTEYRPAVRYPDRAFPVPTMAEDLNAMRQELERLETEGTVEDTFSLEDI